MENSPPPNDAAKVESRSRPPSPSPSPLASSASKKPKLVDPEEEDRELMEVDVTPEEIASWEPHVDEIFSDDSEEDEALWDRYLDKTKDGGYDLDFNGPGSVFGTYVPYWNKSGRYPDHPYPELIAMAEFVINGLNAESNDKTYKLVEVERAVWTTSLLYLLTFIAKELGAGVDDNADAVVITFQATVLGLPKQPYELVERRVKPVVNAKDDNNIR